MEAGHIRATGELDADGLGTAGTLGAVELGELFADFGGSDTDDGVASCVVADGAAEHLSADHALAEAVEIAFEGVGDDETQEILGALAAGEGMALEHLVQVCAHGLNLLRKQEFPRVRRT